VILLDTHAAVWFLRDDESLGRKTRAMAVAALEEGHLAISAISFWELALLISKGRLRTLRDPREQRRLILQTGIQELPLTGDIAVLAVEIENLGSDPADRFIAATAILHDATLVTADGGLLNWRSKVKRQNAET
jgi:PIN domain nuclease of toxin-antitoxin system